MRKLNLNYLRFVQLLRTSSSEVYILWSKSIRIGRLSVHHDMKHFYADLIVECKADKSFINELVDEIYNFYGNPEPDRNGNDLMITAFFAQEADYYSGTYDHSDRIATSQELQELRQQISKYTGKHQRILGQLNEAVARSYFEHFGYLVRKGTTEEDAHKIDLVARKDGTDVIVQVKSGDISYKTMYECIRHVRTYRHECNQEFQIAFVGRSFPPDLEFKRIEMEAESGCRILCINSLEITRTLPEYRHSLS